jgi:hypothetical protein
MSTDSVVDAYVVGLMVHICASELCHSSYSCSFGHGVNALAPNCVVGEQQTLGIAMPPTSVCAIVSFQIFQSCVYMMVFIGIVGGICTAARAPARNQSILQVRTDQVHATMTR